MDKVIETWNGEWWLPNNVALNVPNSVGRLIYYEDKNPELKITVMSTANAFLWPNKKYPVIYGTDAQGHEFSLFNAVLRPQKDSSKYVFSLDYILIGAQIPTLNDTLFFTKAIVKFPHLRDLFVFRRVEQIDEDNATIYKINNQPKISQYPIKIDNNTTWIFVSDIETSIVSEHFADIHIHQDTSFVVESTEIQSAYFFIHQIYEFSQFLSVALFSNQQPSEIVLVDENGTLRAKLLYKPKPSAEWHLRFIGDSLQNSRISELLKHWHTRYNEIAPISSYLIKSTDYQTEFDAPDFLIVAQALDGYWKRFFNKQRTPQEKDIRKYEDEIKNLLSYFKEVCIVQNLGLDANVATQTRNKYSHWSPEGEKGTEQAVSDSKQLRILTLRMKILLLCCLLDYMGLSPKEIDTSFKLAGDIQKYLQ